MLYPLSYEGIKGFRPFWVSLSSVENTEMNRARQQLCFVLTLGHSQLSRNELRGFRAQSGQ